MSDQEQSSVEMDTPSFIVGVGASAGGLAALEDLFKTLPDDSGLAFVVIQHLSPDYKSMMVELLSKHTAMPVLKIEDGMRPLANHLYLIPPRQTLTFMGGRLLLEEQPIHRKLILPIDIFLRTLAEELGERAIAVILSGTGSDGTLGSRVIKEAGGMVMVQDPHDAQFDGMPLSTIDSGMADYVLSAREVAPTLMQFINHPYVLKHEEVSRDEYQSPVDQNQSFYARVLTEIREQSGVDFTFYKNNTIQRRIERRMTVNQVDDYAHYLNHIAHHPEEVRTLFNELLIGVTRFFREKETFERLREQVIPEIFKAADSRNPNRQEAVRIWVAGCSTGEEAYTLAMLFQDYIECENIERDFKIFATDLDKRSLDVASTGCYSESIVADIPSHLLQKYLSNDKEGYQVSEALRKRVIFAHHNLATDPPFSRVDLISCRNLLIYLQNSLQQRVMELFGFALYQNSYMLLGSSETVGEMHTQFRTFDSAHKIYQNRERVAYKNSRASLPGTTMPHYDSDPVATHYPQRSLLPSSVRNSVPRGHQLDSAYRQLMSRFVPPTAIVDQDNNLLNRFGDTSNWLKLPDGDMSTNLLKMADRGLSATLSTALHKLRNGPIDAPLLSYPLSGVELQLERVSEKGPAELMMISFMATSTGDRDSSEAATTEIRSVPSTGSGKEAATGKSVEQEVQELTSFRVEDLESELQYTRENLQATIEEMETSNEELQATNEELTASNEELQSTNEELQSVNEELYTVNSQYQLKIDELVEANSDIDNLLHNIDVGIIFLDEHLKLRRITQRANRFFHVQDSDIGRPFHHITSNVELKGVKEKVEGALYQGEAGELEGPFIGEHGWARINIRPYRSPSNKIKGVVLTNSDISQLIWREKELSDVNQRLREKKTVLEEDVQTRGIGEGWSLLDRAPLPMLLINPEGGVERANYAAVDHFGYTLQEAMISKPLGNLFEQLTFEQIEKSAAEGEPLKGMTLLKKEGEAVSGQTLQLSHYEEGGVELFIMVVGG
ncbi:MAG: PAS domain-containing protein [Gammaproteobacteria bacterium]|jgi:two-component system CheB/CheR fusion protein|nr:PAS domain-containing protein [Gammaproteobacteria bacterium]MBT3488960.1 PAS domain-containing protein [Gammaproteobacteria bacterium]MBT3719406.1 PAS domain-containing protein [Gammaproteobacteria bacterium]MBT3844548.1 PAS domain-containing protein [Gammaproteobacteria bacterium]MBT3893783.1 PAS domain-containing protein [Gammaproteobacteria bacterium]